MIDVHAVNLRFARNLRYYLDRDHMTQKDLADRLHVSPTSVSEWLKARKSPRIDKVDKMCAIFGCTRADFDNEIPGQRNDQASDVNNSEGYYVSNDTLKVAQDIFSNPDMRILFDAAKNSKPEDLQMAADLLKRLKETNND